MRPRPRKTKSMSDGQRARALAYILVALVGMGMGYLTVVRLDSGASLIAGFSWYERWIVVAAGLGAVASLFLAGDRIGQGGRWNALRATSGALWLSVVGAIVAGTLALPLYGTMFGPFTLAIMLVGSPGLALVWAVHLMAIHILMGIYQRERDSIFARESLSHCEHPEDLRQRLMGRFV